MTTKILFSTILKHVTNKQYYPKHNLATCPPKEPLMCMDCKVAVVTGGSEGIGFSIANHFLRAGAKAVAITGLNSCNGKEAVACLNNAYGKNRAMFINSNSNCMVQLEETFKVVKAAYDKIDIVVNAAGICDGPKWETEVVTNVIGTIRATLLAYKYVGKEGSGKGGVVVNVAGVSGLMPLPPAPTLCGTQHAIVGFSRSFGDASHVARSGVRVVCLCPGLTSTNFFKNPQNKGMTEQMGTELAAFIKGSKNQSADVAGHAALHLVSFAESGTVWVLEGSRLFVCDIPHWEKYSVLEAQYL